MKVAVLGASGGMGSFFVRYFLERGDTVRGSDPRGTRGKTATNVAKGLVSVSSNTEAAKGCDMTLMAVPMENTLKVAQEVVPKLKPGSTLVEISSVKGETLTSLRKLAGGRVTLLSIHPLFGPALESKKGMKIAVIVGKKEKGAEASESALAKKLFPDARVIPMTRKEHDKAMAVVLSLTHILNVVYAGTVAQFLTPEEFMRVSTPNSSMQLTLAEAVLAQDPRLSYAIQVGNAHTKKVAKRALRELRRAIGMVESSDWKAFEAQFSLLSKLYRSDKRAKTAIREIYSAAEKP